MLKDLKKFSLPEMEEAVLKFWKENRIFQKSLTLRQVQGKTKQKNFVFYEGPPTANGRPGFHHVLARVFKDIILRYKTMRGYFVLRQAGWDTQGLPVEIEVEKELGLKSKQDIEKYGVAEFNQKAKESVWRYKEDWEKLTERIGFWLDFNNAYITYKNEYLEKLWWILAQADKRKLLYQSHKVVPWCSRCGTALSSHELALGYKEVSDQSVYVRFKIKSKKAEWKNTAVLSWTTTPWTLPGNLALAINPEHKFIKVSDPDQKNHWLVLELESAKRLGLYDKNSKNIASKDLIGLEYEPLFNIKALHSKKSYKIYPADFVTAGEGTGVVHTAMMYGEDDYQLGKKIGLPQHHTVNEEGKFIKNVPQLGGLKVKDKETEEKIISYLKSKNLLLKTEAYTHEYPFCWRCANPIIYYARNSWFIGMSRLKKELLAANDKINWVPSHIKKGRFGEWLKDVKDWAISRDRYWGTPLPIWQCQSCGEYLTISGLDDLNKYAYSKNKFFIARHGQAEHNLGDSFLSGDRKTENRFKLTELGLKQAEELSRQLKDKKIDLIFCSPFRRTRQTCEIIGKRVKCPVIFDERLVDLNGGVFNDKPLPEYLKFFENQMERFHKRPDGGENWTDIQKRMLSFFLEVNEKYQGKNVLIISHGDPLWLLDAAIHGFNKEETLASKKSTGFLKVGTFKELPVNNWPYNEDGELDLHRPYIDKVNLKCLKCKGLMKRIKDVVDVWFDSGGMPFASGAYPERFPADYICEAMDQTRGWFYTLLAISVALKKGEPYRNVISLGLILDKHGQKMSKSKGNVVDPWQLFNKYGVDALRWYFYTVNQPGDVKKFDENDIAKTSRSFLMIIYNSYVFWETYSTRSKKQEARSKRLLDKWILARYNKMVSEVNRHLDEYHIYMAAMELEKFVSDLSRWYIRRSRKRPEALPVLKEVLIGISKLMAPFTPFFSEALYKSLTNEKSVHLEDYPSAKNELIDEELLKNMEYVRLLASLALAKRAEAGIKVRQPLQKFKIQNSKFKIKGELLDILKEEINVKTISFDKKLREEVWLDTRITPALRQEGQQRELMRLVQDLRQDAGLTPKDKIVLYLQLPDSFKKIADKKLQAEVNAKEIILRKSDKFMVELSTKLDGQPIWLGLKKA